MWLGTGGNSKKVSGRLLYIITTENTSDYRWIVDIVRKYRVPEASRVQPVLEVLTQILIRITNTSEFYNYFRMTKICCNLTPATSPGGDWHTSPLSWIPIAFSDKEMVISVTLMMLLMILTHNRPPGQELGTSETRVQGRWQEPLKLEIYLILFKFKHLT